MASWKKPDWKLLVALVALIVSVFAGAFWRRADIVFDSRAVEIPLSDPIRKSIEDAFAAGIRVNDSIAVTKNGQQIGQPARAPFTKLPNKLLYVNVRNVGHVPSTKLKVRLMVPGVIADKELTDGGPAFGPIDQRIESDSTGELSFECQNLANHPDARIKIALWYQQTKPGPPSIQIQDTSLGPAREVGSVDTAHFFWWDWSDPATKIVTSLLAVFFPLVACLVGYYFGQKKEPAQSLKIICDRLNCSWAEGSVMGQRAMQVFVTASLSTSSPGKIEIVRAYLKGTMTQRNLILPIRVSERRAVTVPLHFFVQPLIVKVGEAYHGSVMLVDSDGNEYEGPPIDIPYRGASAEAQ